MDYPTRERTLMLAEDKTIAVMDIGTTKVTTVVGRVDKRGLIEVFSVGKAPSRGLHKATVDNIEETVSSMNQSLEEAKRNLKIPLKNIRLGISGSSLKSFSHEAYLALKAERVTELDIQKVFQLATSVTLPDDREILHAYPNKFRVDQSGRVKNPLGHYGKLLELMVHIVTVKSATLSNIIECVERCHLSLEGIIAQSVASSLSNLSLEERKNGVVLIDIGGGSTDVAIWRNDQILESFVLPIGGTHFTNDLAAAFNLPFQDAEKLKFKHGDLGNLPPQENLQQIQVVSKGEKKTIKKEDFNKVLYARAEELFKTIRKHMSSKFLTEGMISQLVLTGGGCLLPSIQEVAEGIFSLKTRLGCPGPEIVSRGELHGPKYSTVLGLFYHDYLKHSHLNYVGRYKKLEMVQRFRDQFKGIMRQII